MFVPFKFYNNTFFLFCSKCKNILWLSRKSLLSINKFCLESKLLDQFSDTKNRIQNSFDEKVTHVITFLFKFNDNHSLFIKR